MKIIYNSKIFLCLLLVSMIFSFTLYGVDKNHEAASLYGKYSGLLKKIHCNKRKGSNLKEFTRFNFKDAGFFKGGNWCGKKKGPAGYYVLHHGDWYVWKKLNNKFNRKRTASIGGKYRKLLKVLNRPLDKSTYKEFIEYGYKPYGLRLGTWAPAGFYVYVYPKWYIWKEITPQQNIPQNAYQNIDYIYAYSQLLQVIYCPQDKERYGLNYEDTEHDSINNMYCGLHIIKGHWVYSYPNWYVWKSIKKVEDYREIDPNADWPPTQ